MQKNQNYNLINIHTMKANFFILTLAATFILVACKSPKVITQNGTDFKLAGTSWHMHQRVEAQDAAPTITFDYVLSFVNDKEVTFEQLDDYSSYSGMMMNADGSVDHHPGHSERNIQKGKYTVKGDVITVTLKDPETGKNKSTEYIFRKSYLIYKLSEAEYDQLPSYQRDYYTYKLKSFLK